MIQTLDLEKLWDKDGYFVIIKEYTHTIKEKNHTPK